ncbi:MAG: YbjN domain-containing protein [Clostridia bacterium]|nr:YbjN domain-containing protein [Clostridia bacterium]
MATDKEMKNALEVFATLKETLDARNWTYDAEEDELRIHLGVNGDDIPMRFIFICDAERQLLRILSFLPFEFDSEKRVLAAISTAMVNYDLVEGSFDTSIENGNILYRINTSFRDSIISVDLIDHMIDIACFTVDKYNEGFYELNSGKIGIEEFMMKYL